MANCGSTAGGDSQPNIAGAGSMTCRPATTLLVPTLRWHRGSCSYLGDGIAAAPLKWRRWWRGLSLRARTLRWHRCSRSYLGGGFATALLKWRRWWRGLSLWARSLRWHRGSCSYLRYCGSTAIQHRWRGLSLVDASTEHWRCEQHEMQTSDDSQLASRLMQLPR